MVRRTLLGRSALGLGIYSLCIVFVLSFLLFEVLDIDGSDFQTAASQVLAAEPPHADARRLQIDIARDGLMLPVPPSVSVLLADVTPISDVHVAPPLPVPPRRHHRLLARASLDVPPSA